MSDHHDIILSEIDALPDLACQPARLELTDAGNGQRFFLRHGADVKFVPEWGWLVWTGTHWARDELHVRDLMIQTARLIHVEAATLADPREQELVSKWARTSQQAQRVQAALWCAQPALAATVGQFDKNTWILPVLNGTIDLRSGELYPHNREHYCTKLSPVYLTNGADCPIWKKFLARVIPDIEVRDFIQRFAGYSLTGDVSEQVLAFLYGGGRNGKSVFLEVLAALFGEYHQAAHIQTLSVKGNAGVPNDVAKLAGARLVTVSEVPEGARMNESLIKDLSGGDTITARFLRQEFFQFVPQFKLWIRGNHKPQIRGTDNGIWRRLMLIPFTEHIRDDEVDSNLKEKLLGELPGILTWAVEGCLHWQKCGLKAPQAVAAAVSEYRAESDTLGQFITECCVTYPGARATAADLYARYREWCAASGHFPGTSTWFGRALGERGFEKSVPKNVIWLGIDLNSDSSDSCDSSPSSTYTRAHERHEPKMGSQLSEPSEPLTKDAPGEIF